MQAALKLVLEPIFEADFKPCSYGFRPKRRAQDAIAEIHHFGTTQLRVGVRGGHQGVLRRDRPHRPDGPCATIGSETSVSWAGEGVPQGRGPHRRRHDRETTTGTPQGGILSPLLANIALSVLDEHFAARWAALGLAVGTRTGVAAPECRPCGSSATRTTSWSWSPAPATTPKRCGTRSPRCSLRWACACRKRRRGSCHIDEGFDFLGWRIQRRREKQDRQAAVYTYPSKKALASIMDKVRALTRRAQHRTLADLLRRLNPVLRGWCNYFRHGVSTRTFGYLDHFAFWRYRGWLRKRHLGLNMHTLVRRYLPGIGEISDEGIEMFRPQAVAVERYRYRGTRSPHPGRAGDDRTGRTNGMTRGEPDAMRVARPVRRAGRRNPPIERWAGRSGPTPTSTASSPLPGSGQWPSSPSSRTPRASNSTPC